MTDMPSGWVEDGNGFYRKLTSSIGHELSVWPTGRRWTGAYLVCDEPLISIGKRKTPYLAALAIEREAAEMFRKWADEIERRNP